MGMWRLKLKLPSGKQLLGQLALKHKVILTGYPLSYWKDKNWIYLVVAGFVFGEEKNKKAFFRDAKKDSAVVEMEISGDFLVGVTRQPLFSEQVYDPRIIRPNPVVINKDGFHVWDLASFERKVLEKVLDFAEKYLDAEVLTFKEEKLTNISLTKLLPELTDNQKKALGIAIDSGYYDYPKHVKMEDLARKMGISYSTFQAHLKKAEGKIMPFVFKRI